MCSLSSNFHITICKCPWYVTQQFRRTIRNFQVLFLNYTPHPHPDWMAWIHMYKRLFITIYWYQGHLVYKSGSMWGCDVLNLEQCHGYPMVTAYFPSSYPISMPPTGCLWCHAVMVNLMYNKYYARRKSYSVYRSCGNGTGCMQTDTFCNVVGSPCKLHWNMNLRTHSCSSVLIAIILCVPLTNLNLVCAWKESITHCLGDGFLPFGSLCKSMWGSCADSL